MCAESSSSQMLFEIWEKKRARKHLSPARLPKYLNKKGGIRRLSSLISHLLPVNRLEVQHIILYLYRIDLPNPRFLQGSMVNQAEG